MECLESKVTNEKLDAPHVDAKIIDSAAAVNILRPKPNTTFEDYATDEFFRCISNKLKGSLMCRYYL